MNSLLNIASSTSRTCFSVIFPQNFVHICELFPNPFQGGKKVDVLEKVVVDRMRHRFHPFLSEIARWRHCPEHMARLLEKLNPLHIIAVTDKAVVVDGGAVEDERSLKEKYSLTKKAVSKLFEKTEETHCVAGNCELSVHKSGVVSINLYWGSVWYLIPSIPEKIQRFAFTVDPNHPLCPREKVYTDENYVKCVTLVEEEPKAELHVSRNFFLNPKPENVELFGDLCFFMQMRKKWGVNKNIELNFYRPPGHWTIGLEDVANVLKTCVGLKSLVSHGYKELLLRSSNDSQVSLWRKLLKLLEV